MVFSNTLSTHKPTKNVTVTISTNLHARVALRGGKEHFQGFRAPTQHT
jgi:hypothetical protein